jgi:hypothetical protein
VQSEEKYFRRFLEDLAPSDPVIKIYRIERNGKQVCLDCVFAEITKQGVLRFPQSTNILHSIRVKFGPGRYLLRTVYSNGRFGPSRVVHIG